MEILKIILSNVWEEMSHLLKRSCLLFNVSQHKRNIDFSNILFFIQLGWGGKCIKDWKIGYKKTRANANTLKYIKTHISMIAREWAA